MLGLRVVIGVLIAVAIAIAVVPLAVLADLKDGGSGWGMCPQGLAVCRNGYFAGFELLAGVVIALVAVLVAIHVCVRLLRRMERQDAARAFVANQQAAWVRQQESWKQREAAWVEQSPIPGAPSRAPAPATIGSVAPPDPGR